MPKEQQNWWDWLDDHIQRGDARDIAPHYKGGREPETIRAFCRTPKEHEPTGTGQMSPPQVYEEFFAAFYLVKPKDALAMHNRLNRHINRRVRAHALSPAFDEQTGNREIVKLFDEWLGALLLREPPDVVEKQLNELYEQVEVQLTHIQSRHLKKSKDSQNDLRVVKSATG